MTELVFDESFERRTGKLAKSDIRYLNKVKLNMFDFKTSLVEIRKLRHVECQGKRIAKYSVETLSKSEVKEKYGKYNMFKVIEPEINKTKTIAYIA